MVDNVVAVAATDSNDQLVSFSNHGATRVHLATTGVNILSSLTGNQYVRLERRADAAEQPDLLRDP